MLELWCQQNKQTDGVFNLSRDIVWRKLEELDRNNSPHLLGYLDYHIYEFSPASRHRGEGGVTHNKYLKKQKKA